MGGLPLGFARTLNAFNVMHALGICKSMSLSIFHYFTAVLQLHHLLQREEISIGALESTESGAEVHVSTGVL